MNEQTTFSGTAYTWSLVTYAEEEALNRLWASTKHFAYCHHDKDTTEEGNPKEPHTHIICTFEQRKSIEVIRAIINSEHNTLGECRRKSGDKWIPLNVKSLFEYLIHLNNPNKYQYPKEKRIVDDMSYWSRYDDRGDVAKNEQFIADLLEPRNSKAKWEYEMALKYGKDFIKNIDRYRAFREAHITDDIEWETDWSILEIMARKYERVLQRLYHMNVDPTLAYKHTDDYCKSLEYYRNKFKEY